MQCSKMVAHLTSLKLAIALICAKKGCLIIIESKKDTGQQRQFHIFLLPGYSEHHAGFTIDIRLKKIRGKVVPL